MQILDIHTHKPYPQPDALISLDLDSARDLHANQFYSIGFHPWLVASNAVLDEARMNLVSSNPNVLAVGESGIDILRGGLLFKQINTFRSVVKISEELKRPLIVHDVKGHDIIVGLKKDLHPAMPWALHGFRGKPSVADMMLRQGMYLSFGEQFNPDTVKMVPAEFILAETDNSEKSIQVIISLLSQVRGEDLTDTIIANTQRFLGLQQ